jgi:glucokinase
VKDSPRAIGIDIGGTKTAVAAVDEYGQFHERLVFETQPERGFEVFVGLVEESVRRALKGADRAAGALCGIGIGCAGSIDAHRGTIHNAYTLPGWDGADIVTPVRESFGVPVRLENDADAAALGEFRYGAGRGANPLVMVTLGTGIGGAALVNGQIYRGARGEHPEIGHIPVLSDGPECYCGRNGCWESLASGTAIGAAGKPFGFADSHAVFAALASDAKAASIVERAVKATATATWMLIHTFLPQRIILGGGIGVEHFELFAGAMREEVARATQPPKDVVEIVKAQLGADAGVVGAACLVLQTNQSKEKA